MSPIRPVAGPAPASPPPAAALLAEITAGVAAGDDLHDLLGRLLEPILRIAGAQAGAVRVLAGDRMLLVGERGLPDGVREAEQSVEQGCGVCGVAARGDQPVWADDLGICARRSGGEYFGSGCRRVMALPLQRRGRVLGVYNLFFDGLQAPEPDVLALLRSVGELLGLALDNARLEAENVRAAVIGERHAMAAEVHDSLAQSLAFAKLRMPLLRDAMLAHDDDRTLRYWTDLSGALSQAHTSLRGILTQMRAPMDPQGLVHALGASAADFRRSCGTELEFVNEIPGLRLGAEHEAQVFHIVQEALANVARHAAARHARLHIAPAGAGAVEIVVDDDGAGLPATATASASHYGLQIMRERAQRLGGGLEVAARDGGGTRVRLVFPLAVPTAPESGVSV